MSITIHTEALAYTEFRDFIISSANWFVPSLLQMPNLDEWILKMYHNGSMYYTISGSNIISLIVGYYNREERFLYIPYVCVNPDHQGHGISKKTINYIIEYSNFIVLRLYRSVLAADDFHLLPAKGYSVFQHLSVSVLSHLFIIVPVIYLL